MTHSKREKVQLTLSAKDLKQATGFRKILPDPFAVVTLLSSDGTNKPKVLGRTECIEKDLNPQWTKPFILQFSLGTPMFINIGIYDRRTKHKVMGSAVFEIGEVLGSPSNSRGKTLKKGGIIFATVQKAKQNSSGRYFVGLSGVKLKNVESLFGGKSDPFFEISRSIGDTSQVVHRSEYLRNNLNPHWKVAVIDLDYLCNGNLDEELYVQVFDFQKNGKHQPMGKFQTSVNSLIEAHQKKSSFHLMKEDENFGSITIHTSKLEKYTSVDECSQRDDDAPTITKERNELQQSTCSQNTTESDILIMKKKVPNFIDYISANCELELCIAIDFTKSNGNPHTPGTLHHVHHDNTKNDYEKAIEAVASIIAKYDHDQKFPVWGFGAKFGGGIKNCFQVGAEPQVSGMKGLLEAYRGIFKNPIVMSGPADFTEVIKRAAQTAKESLNAAKDSNRLSYTVLLILTCGVVSNIQETMQALRAASDAPLSIVIVGIGRADFGTMKFLDDFAYGKERDICQFVEFEAYKHSKLSLTSATMEEIPKQLVDYFVARELYPDPNYPKSMVPVVSESDDFDLDLNLEIDSTNDEMTLSTADEARLRISFDDSFQSDARYVSQPNESSINAFKVMMPPGVMPGSKIEVESPYTGRIIELTVPYGVPPGGTFVVNG